MKIAYPIYTDAGREGGVLKKIVDQVSYWINQGVEAKLFVQWPNDKIWDGLRLVPFEIFPPISFLKRFSKTGFGVDRILKYKPDLVYMRFGTFFPPFGYLADQIPTVLEINTDDLSEYNLQFSRRRFWYHKITRGEILRRAIGSVFVTHELLNLLSFSRYQKSSLVLANGIDLASYPVFPPPDNSHPRLIFIGTPNGQPWHGVDKILRLARYFPEWTIDIIGSSAEDIHEKIPPNIKLHGYLYRNEYEPFMQLADVAIGSMSLHANRIAEASPLKVREYLAYGIPVIIGYQDTDFLSGHPLILRLPNTVDNIDTHLHDIQDFVNRVKGRRVERASIACIDRGLKEQARLEFFRRLLKK